MAFPEEKIENEASSRISKLTEKEITGRFERHPCDQSSGDVSDRLQTQKSHLICSQCIFQHLRYPHNHC